MAAPDEAAPNVQVIDHPLIQHKLSFLRSSDTGHRPFRALVGQIAGLMVFETTRTFPSVEVHIETPLEATMCRRLARPVTIVPVLRAGLAMAEGVLEVMPEARVGHIGLLRDEDTLKPVTYLSKLPRDLAAGPVLLLDPMLATGGSAARACTLLRESGATDIRMLCLVATPEGASRMEADHPNIPVFTAAMDRELNDQGFILPGLGDAGDRLYGT
jgi:uracil phosphoribosyltransferase